MIHPPVSVLYEDDALMVVEKPEGVLTHRGWGRDKVTMVELVREHAGCVVNPIHRLDRATSGVLLFGKGKENTRFLNDAFLDRSVEKRYLALVLGQPPEEGCVDRPLSRDLKAKGRPRSEPVPSFTLYRKCYQTRYCALVEAMPLTGRVHQIRRHMFHLGHAIAGDRKHGFRGHNRIYKQEYGLTRLALHAWRLAFEHPLTQERIVCTSALPVELRETLLRVGVPGDFLDEPSNLDKEWPGWMEMALKVREFITD